MSMSHSMSWEPPASALSGDASAGRVHQHRVPRGKSDVVAIRLGPVAENLDKPPKGVPEDRGRRLGSGSAFQQTRCPEPRLDTIQLTTTDLFPDQNLTFSICTPCGILRKARLPPYSFGSPRDQRRRARSTVHRLGNRCPSISTHRH
jgi:hypothetical protein